MSDLGPTKFVILAAPRSGSNMLCSLLHSHPNVLCHHELYNPADIFYALPLRNSDFQLVSSRRQRDDHPLAFLAKVWNTPLNHACVGFKMTHRQNPVVFDALLADVRIKKIILKRHNAVKVHVSKLIAEHNGVWEQYHHDKRPVPSRVTVDLQQLQQDIEFNQAYYEEIDQKLSKSQQHACVVHYEQLNQVECHHRLLSFLNLNDHPLQTQSVKQNSADLSQLISNYPQLLRDCSSPTLKQQLTDLSI